MLQWTFNSYYKAKYKLCRVSSFYFRADTNKINFTSKTSMKDSELEDDLMATGSNPSTTGYDDKDPSFNTYF